MDRKCQRADTHLERLDFTIHKLILRRRTLQPLASEVHWVARGVNVGEHLKRHRRAQVPRHVI
jgi:hypothetical protein